MKKFMVISYDSDERQTFWDRVVSSNKDAAARTVARLRHYAKVVDVLEGSDLTRMGLALDQASIPSVRAEWRELVDNHLRRS